MNRLQRNFTPRTERTSFVPRLPHPSWRPEVGASGGRSHVRGRVSADDFWQRLGI